VYELHDVTLRVGDRTLLDRLSWHLGPGDRIGLVGVNGSGKTSLLRLLAGELRPAAGRVVTGMTVRVAYLSQEVTELDPGLRVLTAVEAVKRVVDLGKGRELTASQLCERFGFAGDRQWTPVGELSGGERRRLQLLRLLMAEPNVLLLDEPTNDLDIETLTALEDLLDGWPGTLVVVSHDRYFVERVCDKVVALLGDGGLRHLPGGVDEYLSLRRAALEAQSAAVPAARRTRGDSRAAKKELGRIERQLGKLESRESALHEQMATHATDHVRLGELDAELRRLHAEKDQLEERWLELAEDT
jgi:ABC transport system ATP-binding/permease protein